MTILLTCLAIWCAIAGITMLAFCWAARKEPS